MADSLNSQVLPSLPPNPTADTPSTTVSGRATWFGLNPPDSNGRITEDTADRPNSGFFNNPSTNSPYNSHDPQQAFASLPFSVYRSAIGDPYDQKLRQAVSNGAFHVKVTANGVTKDLPIGDLGPAAWTGNALDLSGGAALSMGLKDNTMASYQIIGPDNKPVFFKGNLDDINPNAQIDPGVTRSFYSNQTLQRYQQFTGQFPWLKLLPPETVARVNDYLRKGGNLYDLDKQDQLSYHITTDPTFLFRKENFPIFKDVIWKNRPNIGDQVGNILQGIGNNLSPEGIQNAINSALKFGQEVPGSLAAKEASSAQGIGEGIKDGVDFLDSAITNISNFPRSVASMFPGVNEASRAAIDNQNAQDAQALFYRSFQRSSWINNAQQMAGNAYRALGFLDLGNQIKQQSINPDPAIAMASNPTNYIPFVGGGFKAIKPLFYEAGINAMVAAEKADFAGTAVKSALQGTGQAMPMHIMQGAAATAMSDANRIASAISAHAQEGGSVGNALQTAGALAQKTGQGAQAIANLPETIASSLAPNNPEAQAKITRWADMAIFGTAEELGGPQGALAVGAIRNSPEMLINGGKWAQIAGREASFGETSLPYFRRMAEQTQGLSRFVANTLDKPLIYTLASATKGSVSGAGLGSMIGAIGTPMPNLESAVSGATQGALYGMAGGGLGQWLKYSSPGQFMMEATGDMRRFKSTLMTSQMKGFNNLSPSNQLMLSQWAQHYPGTQFNFIHDASRPSGWRMPNENGTGSSITINTASQTPLDGVIAHELAHAAVHNGNYSNIVDAILGNQLKGLNPQYTPEEFSNLKQTYLSKLSANGQPTSHLTDADIALELFAEHGVDYLKSGNALVDAKSAFNPAVAANPSVMKESLAKLGYTFDQDSNIVRGTGLFGDQPANKDVYGLQKAYMAERQKYDLDWRDDRVDRIYTPEDQKSSPGVLERLKAVPEIARDSNGNVKRDSNGNILYLSKSAVEKAAQTFGNDLREKINFLPQDIRDTIGHFEDKGITEMRYVPDSVINDFSNSNKYNSEQIKNFQIINDVLKDPARAGEELRFAYQAAMKGGRYGSIGMADRNWVPYGVGITKPGNVLIRGVDFSKLLNSYVKLQNKPFMKDAGFSSPSDFAVHANKYFENHSQNLPGATGLDANPGKAALKKDAINAALGLNVDQWRSMNPFTAQIPHRTGSFILSPRLDRVNQVTPTGELKPFVRPEQYGMLTRNYRP